MVGESYNLRPEGVVYVAHHQRGVTDNADCDIFRISCDLVHSLKGGKMYPHQSPNTGWLTKKRLAILTLFGICILFGLAIYVLASIKMEKRFQEKSITAQEELREKKKKPLKDGVNYDTGLEETSIHLGGKDEFKSSRGQVFLYIRTDQPMTEESRRVVESKIKEISYVIKETVRVDPHGVAVEKLSSRYETVIELDKALITWTRVRNRILKILKKHAKFEVEE